MTIELKDIWVAAGVLLGFQVASFAVRVKREISVGQGGDVVWLPPADMLNLVSMVILVVGIFILPALTLNDDGIVNMKLFGLAMLLFVGYPFALAGHYGLYKWYGKTNTDKKPELGLPNKFYTRQELIVIAVTAAMAILYVIIASVQPVDIQHPAK